MTPDHAPKSSHLAGKHGRPASQTRVSCRTGYGLALVATDLTNLAEQIVGRYTSRWSIETAFFDACQSLGVGAARNRTRLAVQRTVPFGLLAYTLVIA